MYTIGDFLIQIKNGYMARKKRIEYPFSKAVLSIAKILEKEGYVLKVEEVINEGKKKIAVELKYEGKMPGLSEVKLISKPSLHNYIGKSKIRKMIPGHSLGILSTSKGMMTSKQAQKEGIGGELICQIS